MGSVSQVLERGRMGTLVSPVPMEVSLQEAVLAVGVPREAGQAEVGRSFPGTRICLCHSKTLKGPELGGSVGGLPRFCSSTRFGLSGLRSSSAEVRLDPPQPSVPLQA